MADKDALVIFDVDDVLIMPTDEYAFKAPIRKELTKKLKEKYSKDQLKDFFGIILAKRTVKLVDPEMLNLIKKLKQRKIPMIALTSWWTGKYGKITKIIYSSNGNLLSKINVKNNFIIFVEENLFKKIDLDTYYVETIFNWKTGFLEDNVIELNDFCIM